MTEPPFPFLSTLPLATSAVANLSKIQLFSDTAQQLIFTQGHFSIERYQQTDFYHLMLDFPQSIKKAVVKRQAEYLAGRYLSRLAMRQSGLFDSEPPQLRTGLLRAPDWPEVVTGSLTHHQSKACAVVLTQPLSTENLIGVDTELWLTKQQASEVAESIHNSKELQILLHAGFTSTEATTLLFSAKEALFKAICPFIGEYFGFKAAELKACSWLAEKDTVNHRIGWFHLELLTNWVAAKAPQKNYCCWFSCNEFDVLTLISSDAVNTRWLRDTNKA
ncbi:4'-phosphopantetheinyl transferase family protein [Idiomarina xiamenensis]|uniref:Enterobactin synthase component D n=1 Tax=Idiomarina xiamenensis 10-D-4 TaxID=740709 RepID=K2J883_9GAMM|nr:4'-phosphopantetheinyl transferase superfamily protein [Idiomarina xiamenensis]EKE79326.1 4'-phosphopantetheinyl transferase [Idiomarina xiamenensis 10-D-4]